MNLFENWIGIYGAECLSKCIENISHLQYLNIGSNHLGDEATYKILSGFKDGNQSRLQTLVLSNNEIGRSPIFKKLVETLCSLIKQDTLISLDMSWNNLKGDSCKQIAYSFEGL